MAKTKREVFDMLKQNIRPEFLNRIDEIIMFSPLGREEVRSIVNMQFNRLAESLQQQNIKIEITEEAADWLAELGYDAVFGARPVKRVMQKKITNELSKQILSGKVITGQRIIVDVFDHEFIFRNPIEKELAS
jgi:ATP-dependent Clp protease ATP-binding subunit ClpB